MKLSVIIITKNESQDIIECLDSVSFADEIIVVDDRSEDDTVQKCQGFTNKVFITDDWQGFGIQKNRALSHASGDWVLSIDADERVTHKLKAEIQQLCQTGKLAAYWIPRHSFFLGKQIRFGDWHGEKVIRLFQRNKGRFDDAIVHERLVIEGETGACRHPLLHYSYQSQADVDRKIKAYAKAGAKRLRAAGKSSSSLKAYLKGFWAFCRGFIFKAGFLDGYRGFQVAWMNARYTFRKYTYVS